MMEQRQQFEQLVWTYVPIEEAPYWLNQYERAQQKQVEAMIQIALFYKEHQFYEDMYAWLDEAVNYHDSDAYYELANCYIEELGNRGSEVQAFTLYERAALKNHPDAMNNLADMYLNGEGTAVNEQKALEWFSKAAELGVVEAMYTLGIMYEQGLGTEVNDSVALQYYLRSAQGGYDDAMYRVGMIYFSGELNEQQNLALAFNWFLKAAQQYHVDALYNVAYCYELGQGVSTDLQQAIHYYKQASVQGDAEASRKLADIYETIDIKQADKWRKKSAEQSGFDY
jgi:uncharacterized protein